jgi:hypothetical protein
MGGPILTGWMMERLGPGGFFVFIAGLMTVMLVYGVYRSFQRPAPSPSETGSFAPITLTATALTLNAAAGGSDEDAAAGAADVDDPDAEEDLEEFPQPAA